MMSVCVCFQYIANSSFVFLRCIVSSRKSMELCSLSMVNCTIGLLSIEFG
jgi:hypothetical protein